MRFLLKILLLFMFLPLWGSGATVQKETGAALQQRGTAAVQQRGTATAQQWGTTAAQQEETTAAQQEETTTVKQEETTTVKQQRSRKKPYIETYVDTLVANIRRQAAVYNSRKPDYEANIFIKGNVDFLRRNRLQQYLPFLNRADKNINNYYAEFIGGITFTNPNIYNQTLFAISSNKKKFVERHIETIMAPNLRLDVYSQYLYGNLYSPLGYKSGRYYKFSLDSIWQSGGHTYYKIGFRPNILNFKFVQGHIITSNRTWSIREMEFSGGMEVMEYTNKVTMGEEGTPDELLPKKLDIRTYAHILGNRLAGSYSSTIKYNKIEESHFVKERGREKYNLTLQYTTKVDTLSALANMIVKFRDSVVMADMPPIPVRDSAAAPKKAGTWEKMGRFVVQNHSLDLKKLGELRFTPLVSPILFDFSTSNGISYTQKLKYTKLTPKDRLYSFEPRIGYNFKYKEFYWGLKGEVNYLPRKMSKIFIDIGNGNKIKTDRVMNALEELPFMVFDTAGLNLRNFRNTFARAGHKIEVSNGFTVSTNLSVQTYQELHKSDLTLKYPQSLYVKRAKEIARHTYRSFVPEIELTYTPHQYYYYNGERKVYLYSRYPTFTLNFAKAIKGVLNSTTEYNRIEFDMHQGVDIGPMHKFYYRAGAGAFFNYSDLFFAEFNNLRRNNLPAEWDDDIGGAFQLLTRFKYNEIDKYLRFNARYDAPLLLVPSIFRKVKYITREKLYCNLLFVDTMDPYIEMGYGIGTNIFNVGVFWGGEITRWDRIGVKFTFEIFNN